MLTLFSKLLFIVFAASAAGVSLRLALRIYQQRHRKARTLCVHCGYPRRPMSPCSECGHLESESPKKAPVKTAVLSALFALVSVLVLSSMLFTERIPLNWIPLLIDLKLIERHSGFRLLMSDVEKHRDESSFIRTADVALRIAVDSSGNSDDYLDAIRFLATTIVDQEGIFRSIPYIKSGTKTTFPLAIVHASRSQAGIKKRLCTAIDCLVAASPHVTPSITNAILTLIQNGRFPLTNEQAATIVNLLRYDSVSQQTADTILACEATVNKICDNPNSLNDHDAKVLVVQFAMLRIPPQPRLLEWMLRTGGRNDDLAIDVVGSLDVEVVQLTDILKISTKLMSLDDPDRIDDRLIRRRIARILQQFSIARFAELKESLRDHRVDVRASAIWLAGLLGKHSKDVIPELLVACEDQNDIISQNAAKALSRIRSDLTATDTSREVR